MSFQEYPKSVTKDGKVHLVHSRADEDKLMGVLPVAPASSGWNADVPAPEPSHPAATGWASPANHEEPLHPAASELEREN